MTESETSPTIPVPGKEDPVHPAFITPRDPKDPVQLAGYHRSEDLFNWLVGKLKQLPNDHSPGK